MRRYRDVFEEIACEGHEEIFVPVEKDEFEPTDFPAESCEKSQIATTAGRSDYSGRVGTIRPRS